MVATDLTLERETANDDTATVVAVHVPSGSFVNQDDIVFDIENSKATQEVVASTSGILVHRLEVGHLVEFGVPIAQILPVGAPAPDPAPPDLAPPVVAVMHAVPEVVVPPAPPPPAPPPPIMQPSAPPRISHAAAELMAKHDLAVDGFAGRFVTRRKVMEAVGQSTQPHPPAPSAGSALSLQTTRPGASAPTRKPRLLPPGVIGTAVSRRKQSEIEVLSNGAGATMLSVIGTTIGPIDVPREDDEFLQGRITDLLIYEASRLMRRYSRLNAFYEDGQVYEHGDVHAGLAIDDGGKLVVYGIENSDRIGLRDLSGVIVDAVSRYGTNELGAAELTRATFTVTDLSADQLDFVLPLLPEGQSCILGVTRSDEGGYRVFCGFDHRVTEGREVASFLTELRGRLRSFATAQPPGIAQARCVYCERSLSEAVTKSQDKGLLRIVDRDGRDALCCASCWNGW